MTLGLTTTDRLTANQTFIRAYDVGDADGPFGPHYTVTHGWRVDGELVPAQLERALQALVARHPVLSTLIRRDPADPESEGRQEIHSPGAVALEVVDARGCDDTTARTRVEIDRARRAPLAATHLPHLRAVLVEFDDRHRLLVLTFHHLAVDGIAIRVLVRECAELVAREQGLDVGPLAEPVSYQQYTAWEQRFLASPEAEARRGYWRRALRGARIQTWPTDAPRGTGRPTLTGTVRFELDQERARRVTDLARSRRATPFMVYLAAYVVLCSSEEESEVTVPTFVPGRPPGFEETVGPFFNFTPLRIDLDGASTFVDVVERVRATALEVSEHDIPAIPSLVPDTMRPAMSPDAATAVFQVFAFPHLLDDTRVGGLRLTEIRRHDGALGEHDEGAQIPDGCLWTISPDPVTGEVFGKLDFRRDLFDGSTARSMVERYVDLLTALTDAPESSWTAARREHP